MESQTWFAIDDAVMSLDQLVRLFGQIALFVVIRGVVRRHRLDAWPTFRAWAIVGTVAAVASPIGWRLVVRAAFDNSDLTGGFRARVIVVLLELVTYVVLTLLLVRALVRIAQPPPPAPVTATPPYR